MKKTLLVVIALVGISGFLFGECGQLKNFNRLKENLEQGKAVSVIVKQGQSSSSDSKQNTIEEIGYYISHFMYDGKDIHTSRKFFINKDGEKKILIAFTTFKPDNSVIADVIIIDPKTKKETTVKANIGKINDGSDLGNVYLYVENLDLGI